MVKKHNHTNSDISSPTENMFVTLSLDPLLCKGPRAAACHLLLSFISNTSIHGVWATEQKWIAGEN